MGLPELNFCAQVSDLVFSTFNTVSSWTELFRWSMQFGMMMTKEMGTALIEEVEMPLLMEEAMGVEIDLQVHILGTEVALIMDMELCQILKSEGLVPNMPELKALPLIDTQGISYLLLHFIFKYFWLKLYLFDI